MFRLPRARVAPRNVRLTTTTAVSAPSGPTRGPRRIQSVHSVVIVTLSDPSARPDGGCDGCACATEAPRVPVLACADAVTAGGGRAELITACEDAAIDAAV